MARAVRPSVFGIATVYIIHTGQTGGTGGACKTTTGNGFVKAFARAVRPSVVGVATVDIIHTGQTVGAMS
jgi:hypothetical protein